ASVRSPAAHGRRRRTTAHVAHVPAGRGRVRPLRHAKVHADAATLHLAPVGGFARTLRGRHLLKGDEAEAARVARGTVVDDGDLLDFAVHVVEIVEVALTRAVVQAEHAEDVGRRRVLTGGEVGARGL